MNQVKADVANIGTAAGEINYCYVRVYQSVLMQELTIHIITMVQAGKHLHLVISGQQVPVIDQNGNKVCLLKLYVGANSSDSFAGHANQYSFTLSFKDVSSALVSNGVKKLDGTVANSMTADYFYGSKRVEKKAMKLSTNAREFAGTLSGEKIIQDDCIGRGCANVSPSASYGILGNVRDFLSPVSKMGLIGKLGYKTCSSLLNEIATEALKTLYKEGVDPFDNIYKYYRIELKSGSVIRPDFMQGASGEKYTLRMEAFVGTSPSSQVREMLIETDCIGETIDGATLTTPQMYLELNQLINMGSTFLLIQNLKAVLKHRQGKLPRKL